jgi:molybdopterin-containing oxidoreductase family membrane subunit
VNRRTVLAILGLLSALGVVGLASMAIGGPAARGQWGYVAATCTFLLSAMQLAPALALVSRLGRGYWGAPLRRLADLFALGGVVSAPVLLVLLWQLPDWTGRPSIWSDWPGAPHLWDAIAIITLALAGVGLVWLGSRPDRHPPGWSGASRQWRVLTAGLIALGSLYALLVVFVHLLISSDLALSLVPGWHSAVLPAYHVVSGFLTAVALVVVALVLVQRVDSTVRAEPATFHACAKLLLALALLWFYFVWCELLTDWYGRTADEQSILALFMFGPGGGLFLVATLGELVVPLLVLLWKPARTSPRLVTAVAAIVVLGGFVDRLRLYVGAWSVATPTPAAHLPDVLAPLPPPGLPALAACVGVLALATLIVLLALRSIPPIAAWEVAAVRRLTPERRLLRTHVTVVGRPS